MWCASETTLTTDNVIASPAAAFMPSSNITVKRSHAQASMESDDEDTDEAKSSLLLQPKQKRPRRHLSQPTDDNGSCTTEATAMSNMIGIDSLSREELIGMIQQQAKTIAEQADTIAKLAMLVKSNTTEEGAETVDETETWPPPGTPREST
jgi:hypothetical protein